MPIELARSFTLSTTRLITPGLRAARTAAAEPAAAPVAAATAVRVLRVRAAFLPADRRFGDVRDDVERAFELLELRFAAVLRFALDRFLPELRFAPDFLPPFLPASERLADVTRRLTLRLTAPFFAPAFREAEPLDFDDFRDEDFRDELFRPPLFFADFLDEPFFDAAIGVSPFQSVGGEPLLECRVSSCVAMWLHRRM